MSWRVFLTCWLAYIVLGTPYIVREHFPAVTLAEQGSLNVERYTAWTDDIFRGPHGGAFINNNPGASLAGAVPLVILRPLLVRLDAWNRTRPIPTVRTTDSELFWRTLQEGRAIYFLAIAFLTVALVMAPATAGTAAYLCSRLQQAGVSPAGAGLAAVLYALATPLPFRAGHLNHNLLTGDAGFFALLLLWDPQSRPLSTARAAGAGLLAGFALLCDYSGVVVILVVAFYVWMRSEGSPARWKVLAAYAMGVAPGALALLAYQAWAFGSFWRPSQHYMTPTAPTSHGYRGFGWPSLSLMWANFFDPRFGLFAYCPVLLLALAAPFVTRVRHRLPARETGILFLYFGLFVLFCAANQYSWLQPLTGFRYLVPVVPALSLLALQTAQALPAALKWILGSAACAQSLLVALAHENDLRREVSALLERHFATVWIVRLREAAVPVTAVWIAAVAAMVAVTLVWIWKGPAQAKR